MSQTQIVAQRPRAEMTLTEEQVDLVKRTIAKGATDEELALFLHQCKRTGLDPLARQIHMVKRWNNKEKRHEMSIQTGIDGYRLIADRTGRYVGNDDPVFEGQVPGEPRYPLKATVTVWKLVGGQRYPFTESASWDEFYPGDQSGFMWRKMPRVMLGKTAESRALRKAFPNELSGIYTAEEMDQAGAELVGNQPSPHSPPSLGSGEKAEVVEPEPADDWLEKLRERYSDDAIIRCTERARVGSGGTVEITSIDQCALAKSYFVRERIEQELKGSAESESQPVAKAVPSDSAEKDGAEAEAHSADPPPDEERGGDPSAVPPRSSSWLRISDAVSHRKVTQDRVLYIAAAVLGADTPNGLSYYQIAEQSEEVLSEMVRRLKLDKEKAAVK